MRAEMAGWLTVAASFYAFHLVMTLVATGVIEYSRYDLITGIILGFLVVVSFASLLAGTAIIHHEAATRDTQPWL